jgi:hypothetical protein
VKWRRYSGSRVDCAHVVGHSRCRRTGSRRAHSVRIGSCVIRPPSSARSARGESKCWSAPAASTVGGSPSRPGAAESGPDLAMRQRIGQAVQVSYTESGLCDCKTWPYISMALCIHLIFFCSARLMLDGWQERKTAPGKRDSPAPTRLRG